MIRPSDILIRETPNGTTVWVSQRVVAGKCGIRETYQRKVQTLYKQSLPPSWRSVAGQNEFFLGLKPGKSWRWGRKGGQYYYDVDTIPNRAPVFYRDRLPSKEELVALVDDGNLRGTRERDADQRRRILEQVQQLVDNTDIDYFATYLVGDKRVLNTEKARQLAEAVAWCQFIKRATATGEFKDYSVTMLKDFYEACADILSKLSLEGLRVNTPASLRKKVMQAPGDVDQLRHYLVSGKYGNDNPRKIGKYKMVDYTTGEILRFDEHEAAIMTYWLNPGGSTKDSKRSLWQQYASDMEAVGKIPLSPSTFTHYTNTWANKMLSSKERHGTKHSKNTYRPYIPAKPLEFANSLWASDGSGIVPYRYQDQHGKWRMMKLYVMLVSDTASKYIAGYSASRVARHTEDFTMLHSAMQMALRDNGRTEVLDFISDNHGAYTSAESKAYLQQAIRNFRTIKPDESQGNPAEMMFRLFKRKFKSYFNLPETSWNARSLESMANPDYFDAMTLPTYDEAITKLAVAIHEWNTTPLSNKLTPDEWFHTLKNPAAGQYDNRIYRRIAGEFSRRDLSYARGTMILEHNSTDYKFDIPMDADSVALIARYMGYMPSFSANVFWDPEGADVYSPDGVYMFTASPQRLTAKSMSEADSDSLGALGYHRNKREGFDTMLEEFVGDVEYSKDVMFRSYDFNVQGSGTKERYNDMHERISAVEYGKGLAKRQAAETRSADRKAKKANEALDQATLDYNARSISDISKYTK